MLICNTEIKPIAAVQVKTTFMKMIKAEFIKVLIN